MQKLSRRQLETARLAGQGFLHKEIADQFGIARDSVRQHLRRACLKLGARNTTHLAVMVALEESKGSK